MNLLNNLAGAYVHLLEYNNIHGMIAPNEISKFTNIKGVHKILREGKQEVLRVIKVCEEKGKKNIKKIYKIISL